MKKNHRNDDDLITFADVKSFFEACCLIVCLTALTYSFSTQLCHHSVLSQTNLCSK